jgi:hypothetical protein
MRISRRTTAVASLRRDIRLQYSPLAGAYLATCRVNSAPRLRGLFNRRKAGAVARQTALLSRIREQLFHLGLPWFDIVGRFTRLTRLSRRYPMPSRLSHRSAHQNRQRTRRAVYQFGPARPTTARTARPFCNSSMYRHVDGHAPPAPNSRETSALHSVDRCGYPWKLTKGSLDQAMPPHVTSLTCGPLFKIAHRAFVKIPTITATRR